MESTERALHFRRRTKSRRPHRRPARAPNSRDPQRHSSGDRTSSPSLRPRRQLRHSQSRLHYCRPQELTVLIRSLPLAHPSGFVYVARLPSAPFYFLLCNFYFPPSRPSSRSPLSSPLQRPAASSGFAASSDSSFAAFRSSCSASPPASC